MAKVFLSHSSKDKSSYVDIVARMLGEQRIVYDAMTFEEGNKTLDEIEKGLDKSSLFVLFISNNALDSEWVKKEIIGAKERLSKGIIKKIFPIIVDSNVDHKDSRIPDWLRREYNLRYVSRPTVAVRRIKQRLREISWENHPRLREKDQLFVGRNELIRIFEERIDSFDLPTPVCVIASGIKSIGRRSLLKYCFRKANIIDEAYNPPLIVLDSHESIEDFITKVYDLGFSDKKDLTHLLSKELEKKIDLAVELIRELIRVKEILFIVDDGCIVTPEREISDWFKSLTEKLAQTNKTIFGVASSFRLNRSRIRNLDYIFALDVPELEPKERAGLFNRYSAIEQLELSNEDFNYFTNLLNGYPEQVFFTVDLIKELGVSGTKKNTNLIVEYTSEKVFRLMDKYQQDQRAMDFLFLLSEFDFVSYEFIYTIESDTDFCDKMLHELSAAAICENLGSNKEYVRLNDAVRDYVRRSSLKLRDEYARKIKESVTSFIKVYSDDSDVDVSEFLYSMKTALLNGEEIDPRFLIPSHFLKTMTELYDRLGRYKDVVILADRVLQNEKYLDRTITNEIRYYLCLSLARLKDKRFLTEVQKIHGAEHDFLFGFYYRLTGNVLGALERLKSALDQRPNFPRAKRELVQVYLYMEDYETALQLARENYENDNKNNPYHIHAYFSCLIRMEDSPENRKLINELLNRLEKINSQTARDMYLRAKAHYLAFYENEENHALALLEEAKQITNNHIYAYITEFYIYEKFGRISDMENIIKYLEENYEKTMHYSTILSLRSVYFAKIGDIEKAERTISQIRNFTPYAIEKLRQRVNRIYRSSIKQ